MRVLKFWGIASALAALGLTFSCAGNNDSATGSAILYVYDGGTNSVLAWKDVSTLYTSGTAGSADRTITCSTLTNGSFTLASAGMALDSYNQSLYLVSTTGTVVRFNRVGTQNGTLSGTDSVISFTISDTGTDASGGVFGQASVGPMGQTLYVTEYYASGNKSQIWAIPTSSMTLVTTFNKDNCSIVANTGGMSTGETACTGVAASSTALYAYFNSGGTITNGAGSGNSYTAARLRMGSLAGAFSANTNVIVGRDNNSVTMLGAYGCLAYDTGNDILYFARHNTQSGLSGNPVLAFKPGDFSSGFQFATSTTLAGPSDLRVIAHGGKKDWLVGAGNTATSTLWIWKGPSTADASKYLTLPAASGSMQILGLALDGSN